MGNRVSSPKMLSIFYLRRGKIMLVDIPIEWEKYLIPKTRKFKKDTPAEIIKEAREVNKETMHCAGKPFYFFEEDEER